MEEVAQRVKRALNESGNSSFDDEVENIISKFQLDKDQVSRLYLENWAWGHKTDITKPVSRRELVAILSDLADILK